MELKKINEQVSVSPQISVEDVATIKAAGFTTIVNNRPDGESEDQTPSAVIRAEAEAQGLKFIEIPMGREGVSPDMISGTQAALENGEQVFCYCRSGTRSTTLWALSQAGKMDAKEIIEAAANAGYDISHLTQILSQ